MSRKTRISKNRKKIEQEAIQTLRDVRKTLDPELLQRMQNFLNESAQEPDKKAVFEASKTTDEVLPDGRIAVDKEKNMAIIMKFLEGNKGNMALMQQMKQMLLSTEN